MRHRLRSCRTAHPSSSCLRSECRAADRLRKMANSWASSRFWSPAQKVGSLTFDDFWFSSLIGSGKTSLIKSIVQLCEDIVHVDPLTSSSIPKSRAQGKSSAPVFHETYASTRPYPAWWSDTEDSRILKRRKSIGDTVLERNICFVDASDSKNPNHAAHYIEQQLLKTINCANQANSELTSLLSGQGGSQVDVVLYLVSHGRCTQHFISFHLH